MNPSTKARTLARLYGTLAAATVLPQATYTVAQWRSDPRACLAAVRRLCPSGDLIVRSSAPDEDGETSSAAGLYTSVMHVPAAQALDAVEMVTASYARRHDNIDDFEILIQPMLDNVTVSGVAFTRDQNTGGPYMVINYSEEGRTDTVTSGTRSVPRMARIHHHTPVADLTEPLRAVVTAVRELSQLTGLPELDVEFAVSAGRLHILQARPLTVTSGDHPAADVRAAAELAQVKDVIRRNDRPRYGLFGQSGGVYSTMADWNPAEMIGAHPRPLALSLYQRLITREVWREARHLLGYHNPSPHQLMVTMAGHPYVDVRADLNSYLPADLDEKLCHTLVDHYLTDLIRHPEAHDKIEFLICPSALDFDFARYVDAMAAAGIPEDDIDRLRESLLRLTNRIVHDYGGHFDQMHQRIHHLPARRAELLARSGEEHPLFLANALLADAVHYGTLPFAVAVRGTFIGSALWRSLLTTGVIDQDQYDGLLASIETVSTKFAADLATCQRGEIPQDVFLSRYGHLRPGTYDITVPSYAAAPHIYLSGTSAGREQQTGEKGDALPATVMQDINDLLRMGGYAFTAPTLLNFIRETQIRREAYKFEFTANVSEALDLIAEFGRRHGLDTDCLSYLTIEDLLGYANATITDDDADRLRRLSQDRRDTYVAQQRIHLPDVITSCRDIDVVTSSTAANFVTARQVTAPTFLIDHPRAAEGVDLNGRIVLTVNADPGHEFLFSRGIAGLITQYGGAASHMAIRCAELGIPAAIGCGEETFVHLSGAQVITLDCAQKLITPAG